VTGTNPASTQFSPAFQTNPLVFGQGEPEEGHTSSPLTLLRAGIAGSPRTAATKHPEYEIRLYANPACSGVEMAKGLASEFEKPGLQVTVPQDSITTFYARQFDLTDLGHPSPCSGGLTYWEGAVAVAPPQEPPAGGGGGGGGGATIDPSKVAGGSRPDPPRLRTVPGGTANDNTPLVTGTAPGAATVRIFTNPSCDGAPVAKGSAAQFDAGLKVQVVDNVAVAFYGVSVGPNGGQSACSQPVSYVEDSTTPHTRITMGPASKTRKHVAVFRFTDTTGNAPGTAFFCKVDRGRWKPCSSPLRLRRLHLRRYTVQVRATDPAGNAETKGAKRRFKVVPPL
jgi:hypothetical protein